ncbi:MAG: hypothetical protein HYS86_01880 [Candidatus Chisholmbacteria bacterium]|nr:hypothetical protein [Candidatus Chisholmbacteria bacterium]
MNKKWWLILGLIVGISLFLRLWRLEELFYFTHDEETIVWRVMPLLRDKDLFLLGGVTPFHVHLGPWFYYLSAAILALSKLNPLGWGVAAAILGAITTVTLGLVAASFYDRRTGLIGSFLYATSFLIIVFDRHWWPLVFNPLLSLIVIYSLAKLSQKKYQFVLPLSIAIAFGIHTDPSLWALALLIPVVWLKYKLSIKNKSSIIGAAIVLVSFVPLIAFDVANAGTNVRGLAQYFAETANTRGANLDRFIWSFLYIPKTLGRLLVESNTELTRLYSYCAQHRWMRIEDTAPLMTLIATGILAFFLIRKKKKPIDWIISAYIIIIFLGITIYGTFFGSDLFDHYVATLFPLFIIMTALVINKIWQWRRIMAIGLMSAFVILNLKTLMKATNQQGWHIKQTAVTWAKNELQGAPFALESLSSCFRYNGIRYLFTLEDHEPKMSFVDPNFFWLYSEPPSTEYPDTLVLFATPEELSPVDAARYQEFVTSNPKRQQFGALEVLIVPNSNHRFLIDF